MGKQREKTRTWIALGHNVHLVARTIAASRGRLVPWHDHKVGQRDRSVARSSAVLSGRRFHALFSAVCFLDFFFDFFFFRLPVHKDGLFFFPPVARLSRYGWTSIPRCVADRPVFFPFWPRRRWSVAEIGRDGIRERGTRQTPQDGQHRQKDRERGDQKSAVFRRFGAKITRTFGDVFPP